MYKNKSLNLECGAIVAGVSIEYGLEYYELHPKSINGSRYLGFLEGLKFRNENEHVCLISDIARYKYG
jgi:hypothetical protein